MVKAFSQVHFEDDIYDALLAGFLIAGWKIDRVCFFEIMYGLQGITLLGTPFLLMTTMSSQNLEGPATFNLFHHQLLSQT